MSQLHLVVSKIMSDDVELWHKMSDYNIFDTDTDINISTTSDIRKDVKMTQQQLELLKKYNKLEDARPLEAPTDEALWTVAKTAVTDLFEQHLPGVDIRLFQSVLVDIIIQLDQDVTDDSEHLSQLY